MPSATFIKALSVHDLGLDASVLAATVYMACEDPALYQEVWTCTVWEKVPIDGVHCLHSHSLASLAVITVLA